SGGEARYQSLLDVAKLLEIDVTGDDDLLAAGHQGLEGVEEFLLCAALAGEELDVVDQQQIERVVVALEFIEGLALIGAHDVADVLLRVDISDLGGRAPRKDGVSHGMYQMGLAQARSAVQKERVVGATGILGNLH